MNIENSIQNLTNLIREKNPKAKLIIQDLKNPQQIIINNNTRETLLHVAAASGNAKITKLLLERGCKVDALDVHENTPLILASSSSSSSQKDEEQDIINEAVVCVLIKANASVLSTNVNGKCAADLMFHKPLQLTCYALDLLLEKIKIECSYDSELIAKKLLEFDCPLVRAMSLKNPKVTKFMLQSEKTKLNEKDEEYPCFTALQRAMASCDLENIDLLIDHGADVHSANREIENVSRYYLKYEDNLKLTFDMFEFMVNRGISLDVGFGKLLIECLLEYGTMTMVQKILVRVDLSNLTSENCKFALIEYLAGNQNFDPLDEILKLNLNINLTGKRLPILTRAFIAGNIGALEYLLRKGADPNVVDTRWCTMSYCTMLFLGVNSPRWKCIKVLLQYGADVQALSDGGLTIFHKIVECKDYNLAKLLLAHLAMMENLGLVMTKIIRRVIDSHVMFAKYLDVCRRKIEMMKGRIIDGSLSQFELLTASEDEITRLARNTRLVVKLRQLVNYKRRSRFYCYVVMREQAIKIIEIANMRDDIFNTLVRIQGLKGNSCVIRKIVDYVILETENLMFVTSHMFSFKRDERF